MCRAYVSFIGVGGAAQEEATPRPFSQFRRRLARAAAGFGFAPATKTVHRSVSPSLLVRDGIAEKITFGAGWQIGSCYPIAQVYNCYPVEKWSDTALVGWFGRSRSRSCGLNCV